MNDVIQQPEGTDARRPLMFRLLGLKRRPGKRLIRVGLTRWGWVLVVIVLGGIGAAGFAEYSMQPDFCRSCHIMEPYYQAWHTSTHKDVACVDCHFEPGLEKTIKGKWEASSQAIKWATGTYGSKPHAEVRDASCMRSGCHEQRLLEGKVKWPVPSVRGGHVTITFDHAPHRESSAVASSCAASPATRRSSRGSTSPSRSTRASSATSRDSSTAATTKRSAGARRATACRRRRSAWPRACSTTRTT